MFLTALLMSLSLDTVMSFTMTYVITGWDSDFLLRFGFSWLIGFVVALPTSLMIAPIITKIVRKICKC